MTDEDQAEEDAIAMRFGTVRHHVTNALTCAIVAQVSPTRRANAIRDTRLHLQLALQRLDAPDDGAEE